MSSLQEICRQVDRSLLNSRFNIDRDLGMQLRHQSNLGGTFVMRERNCFILHKGKVEISPTGNEGGLSIHSTDGAAYLLETFRAKEITAGSDLKKRSKTKTNGIGVSYDL